MPPPARVLVWNEFRHGKKNQKVAAIYPEGIHETIAGLLRPHPDLVVRTAFHDQPENGLPAELLENNDVLVWWGHMAHGEVSDEVVADVRRRVLEGMDPMIFRLPPAGP